MIEKLFELQDKEYKEFNQSLMPTVDKDTVIGIRVPVLRKYAKTHNYKNETAFLKSLPHRYFEENNLHAFLIESIKDFDECINKLEEFLPYIDNWATCDMLSPKIFKSNTDKLLPYIKKWIRSKHTYTIRYGIGMLMRYFLDENYKKEYSELVLSAVSEEYYVNTMRAWYFATALSKQYESILPYLTKKRLDPWTHNKTIQKAIESYRITKEQKEHLKNLKIPVSYLTAKKSKRCVE